MKDMPSEPKSPITHGVRVWVRKHRRTRSYPQHPFSQEYPYKWFSHIDITNYCPINNCTYCSRFLRYVPKNKRYNLSLEKIDEALISYKGFPERIGVIGGEPLIHPQFKEICKLLLEHNRKEKYGLWTSINPETSKYKDIIKKTFGFVALNEHSPYQLNVCKHQPLTLAAKDMVPNENLRKELYEQCYFRLKWCGTINPLGAFRCEIAASIAYLIGQKGWQIKQGWWLNDWHEQISLCELCGGAVPQERQLLCDKVEKMSPSILKLLKDNNCVIGEYKLVTEPYTIEYLKNHSKTCPGAYRGDLGETEQPTINIEWSRYES
jgi:hypothetical protein